MRWLVLCAALWSCGSCAAPQPAPVPPVPPGLPCPTGNTCSAACCHQRALGCELGKPTPAGASCETVCSANQSEGSPWAMACLSAAKSCKDCE